MTRRSIYCEINDKEILALLDEMQSKVKDRKKVLRSLARIMQKDVEENFETEGKNITGEKWEEWSDPYEAYRAKTGRANGKILQLEGELRKGISRKVTDDEAVLYSDKEYAAIHNFGGDIRRDGSIVGEMPERKFMGWHDELKRKITDELLLVTGLADLGFEKDDL